MELLVETIVEIQDTEDFRSYLSAQLENCCRSKQDLLKQKEVLESKLAKSLSGIDKKMVMQVD